jgi:ketosteroid isomerase-like protein
VKGHAAGQAQAASAAGRSASRGGPAAVAADPALRDTVVQAVEAWRASWSNQDLDVYFSAYADDFVVADRFESMQAWKAYKRWVIGKRKSIQVTLELVKVLPQAADLVRVEFLQHFRADDYKSDDLKVLTLHSSPDGWKIVREESI